MHLYFQTTHHGRDQMIVWWVVWARVGVFNVTFNNISIISWLSAVLVEETGIPRENHRPATNH
jgi:hypothetical protein